MNSPTERSRVIIFFGTAITSITALVGVLGSTVGLTIWLQAMRSDINTIRDRQISVLQTLGSYDRDGTQVTRLIDQRLRLVESSVIANDQTSRELLKSMQSLEKTQIELRVLFDQLIERLAFKQKRSEVER